ncbi:MAG: hypothetical protein ACXAC5_00150 [Promethearchaeota archaeon]|jgi:hypothetical protein
MLALQEAIKKVIERFIVNITPIDVATAQGVTTVPVASSRRYQVGDEVAIYNQDILDDTGEGEIKTIACVPDANTIELCDPTIDAYPANSSFVQKLIGGRFVEGIYLGDPAKISHFPAITINAREKSNEWFTLVSTSETFNIDISVFTTAADYESSYRLMHVYAKRIEKALFRSLFPLVQPYGVTTLTNAVGSNDTVIQVDDLQQLIGVGGYLWLESWDFLRANRVRNVLDADSGTLELTFPVGRDFDAGDNVIRPGRHFYNAFPRGIQYGTINQESAVFKAAVVTYMAQEEVKRGVPFIDPLTF